MANFKVRALYDFSGEPGTSEMSISAGDVLTVVRTDVGEGWWEGLDKTGRTGLFPQAYVEKIEASQPPVVPPPALPPQNQWKESNPPTNVSQEEDWDDDWDNEDTYSEIQQNYPQSEAVYSNPSENNIGLQNHQLDTLSESNFQMDGKGTVTKKSLNRFSSYVKSGLESYILGTINAPLNTSKFRISKEGESVQWDTIVTPYTVQVASPKKATKMGGLKSFIAYHLTPSFSNIEVARRYKHFDWLHDRLQEKFNVIAIPPLPDKQVSGRYEEHFIEHRRAQLQEFVNYMCRHPILSSCEVWHHFLTCTDDKQWKQGKRNAEKDQLIGANFCLQLDAPEKELLASNVENTIESSINCMNQIDNAIKGLMQTAMDQNKKGVNMYKREYTKIGESFYCLGSAFEALDKGMFSQFTIDIKRIGTVYIQMGKLFEDQCKIDWQPLFDKLYLYRGITQSYSEIFQMQKNAEQKKRDCEKNPQISQLQLSDIRKRTDVLTYAVFAELNHFNSEKENEIKSAMKSFLQEQVHFYKNIVSRLEETLAKFE